MTEMETHKFSNGLRVVLEKLPRCRSTGIGIGFPAGGRTEEAGVSGISHYLEHMIFKGTKTVRNIDSAFEQVGANTNAFTEVDATVYLAECPKENALKALEMWLQFLSEAAINPEEFERERGVILSEYFLTEDNPDFLVDKNATLSLFKGHRLASSIIGTENTIKAISHRDMLNYFQHWYHPSNSVIWVSGDLTIDKLLKSIEQHVEWTRQSAAPTLSLRAFKPKGPSVLRLNRKIKLVQMGLAFSSPTQSTEERVALQILGSALSAGQSSILRRRLILEGEFTDRLRTSVSLYREAGMLFTTFAIQPNKVSRVLSILKKTVRELREKTVKFKENFENARSHAVGSLSAGIDRGMMWRTLQGVGETLRRGHCSWDELISSIESLNFEQFQDNVAEITRQERIALVLAGDIKKTDTQAIEW